MDTQIKSGLHKYRIERLGGPQGGCMAEFEAADAAVALFRAERLVRGGGPVSMFEDGRTLGKVELDSSGFWTIAGSGARGAKFANQALSEQT